MVKDTHLYTSGFRDQSWYPIAKRMVGAMKGDEWKSTRTVITPTFSSGKMKRMFPSVDHVSDVMINNVRQMLGRPINIVNVFGCYSMDVIVRCCYATVTNSIDNAKDVFVKHSRSFINSNPIDYISFLIIPLSIQKLLNLSFFNIKSMQFFESFARELRVHRWKLNIIELLLLD